MRQREVDHILTAMLESYDNVSDLNMTVDKPFQVESSGQLKAVNLNPPVERITPFQAEILALNLIGGDRRLTKILLSEGSCDSSYQLPGKARFRVNIFSQKGYYSTVMRQLATRVPTIEELKLPMKLLQTEYLFGASKLLFYFFSENRVDFRELVKELAK